MVFAFDAAWNLLALVAVSIGIVYARRLSLSFRGGLISMPQAYLLYGFVFLWFAFIGRLVLDFYEIRPTEAFGISFIGLAVIAAMVSFVMATRDFLRRFPHS